MSRTITISFPPDLSYTESLVPKLRNLGETVLHFVKDNDLGEANLQEIERQAFTVRGVKAALTRHVPILDAFMVSSKFMAKLSPTDADLVREAGRQASDHQAKVDADEEAQTITDLKSKGIEIVETIDRKPFTEAVAPVYDTAIKRFGDSKLIDLAKQGN